MMRWLRELLLPRENDTEADRARFEQRLKFERWDKVSQAIADAEASIRGERRKTNLGHFPERRHG